MKITQIGKPFPVSKPAAIFDFLLPSFVAFCGHLEAPVVTHRKKCTATLTFKPPADNGGSDVTGYIIERKATSEEVWDVLQPPITTLAHTVEGLQPGVEYQFRVTAVNAGGPGSPSAPSLPSKFDEEKDIEKRWFSGLNNVKLWFVPSSGNELMMQLEEEMEWQKIDVHFAIIGNSGVGKSSLINAIRGLTADEEGAAAVGVIETTQVISKYPHPNNHRLVIWDLPGVGTTSFPRDTYLKQISVTTYHFFLLITATRFTENDIWLGKEIHKQGKKFFFVRTKIALDISNDKTAHPKTHNEKAVIKDIRERTMKQLNEIGGETAEVFLIDNHEWKKYDAKRLEERLVEELPRQQRTSFILSVQADNEDRIRRKVEELRSRIWKVAASSGVAAATPLSGVSAEIDFVSVAKEAEFYYNQLGLDETSQNRYADRTSTEYGQLKAIVDRAGLGHINEEGWKGIVVKLSEGTSSLLNSGTDLLTMISSKWIPVLGNIVAGVSSFAGTFYALNLLLDKMEDVSLEVVRFPAQSL